MKHLLLMRHAKAATDAPGLADRERALVARGTRDAALIGKTIAIDPPDAVLCSPAKRTRETLAAILPQLDPAPAVAILEALYAAPAEYMQTIAANGASADRLLVVGHNPAIHVTALLLAGRRPPKLREKMTAKFPTAALAIIAFDATSWADILPGTGELLAFLRPADLGAGNGDD